MAVPFAGAAYRGWTPIFGKDSENNLDLLSAMLSLQSLVYTYRSNRRVCHVCSPSWLSTASSRFRSSHSGTQK